jgi:hypothetical protein
VLIMGDDQISNYPLLALLSFGPAFTKLSAPVPSKK